MKRLLPKFIYNSRGFTLVELMVAITIIAILATIGITIFSGAQKQARDSKRKQDIDSIAIALETRYNATLNQYCTGAVATYCAPADTWFSAGTKPQDPKDSTNYFDLPVDGATSYTICASMEGGNGNSSTKTTMTVATGASAVYYCRVNQQQ